MKIQSPWFLTVLNARQFDAESCQYSICFVNQTKRTIKNLRYTTAGTGNINGTTSTAFSKEKHIGDLEPEQVVEIEQVEKSGFEEDLQYHFYVEDTEGEYHCQFSIPKHLRGTVHSIGNLPVVQQWGYVFFPYVKPLEKI
ncbi:hypothetical protein E2R51_04105 [Jeotgalibacillus sp. S-D1]|uniref:hypothetical protein n=1 Tax=Jeotgalibacillus sp. S-D1 TaxID=2552189 RepID=UPI001059D7ED|nr:hypothetical protein [Jeotgalibacillus sp. S-D1]TDL34915.1 hypothetical protein E2R51_04105 [Jeotgalibacillus sp. S-D1]